MHRTIHAILSRSWFFYVMMLIFLCSACWIAVTSLYPMAFDEEFHLGLIRLYANNVNPFGITQSNDLAAYGIAGADPSYLFHYLMSFPYRFLTWLGAGQSAIVIILRLMNVILVVASLFVYRRALLKLGISSAITNLALALFSLIPVLVAMAGQINYDNMILFIVASSMYFLADMARSLMEHHVVRLRSIVLFGVVSLVGAATKYAFLPLLAGMVVSLVLLFFIYRPPSLVQSVFRQIRASKRSTIVTVLIIFIVLCVANARYVTNTLTYGTPLPTCDAVFDDVACLQYGPWRRDTLLERERDPDFMATSYGEYIIGYFLPGLSMRLTFAVAGPTNNYQTKPPLQPLRLILESLSIVAGGIFVVALIACRTFRRHPIVIVALLTTICYVIPLSLTLYQSYVATSEPVAINGRYLLPLLPLVAVSLIVAIRRVAPRRMIDVLPYISVIALLAIILLGGGVGTYLLLSEPDWYWQWGQPSHDVLKAITRMVIIHT